MHSPPDPNPVQLSTGLENYKLVFYRIALKGPINKKYGKGVHGQRKVENHYSMALQRQKKDYSKEKYRKMGKTLKDNKSILKKLSNNSDNQVKYLKRVRAY